MVTYPSVFILYEAKSVCLAAAAADESGFLLINECLQSSGGPPEVFAVGDCASSATHPRPKAGVYAVRQVRHTQTCYHASAHNTVQKVQVAYIVSLAR